MYMMEATLRRDSRRRTGRMWRISPVRSLDCRTASGCGLYAKRDRLVEYSATKSAPMCCSTYLTRSRSAGRAETSRYGKSISHRCVCTALSISERSTSFPARPAQPGRQRFEPEVCGLCYGARGSLTSPYRDRASSGDDWPRALAEELKFLLYAACFGPRSPHADETIRVGTTGGARFIYDGYENNRRSRVRRRPQSRSQHRDG